MTFGPEGAETGYVHASPGAGGLSWQVVPVEMAKLFTDSDPAKAGRVMNSMLKMKKLDINELKRAAAA
jgi:hypothetical protein